MKTFKKPFNLTTSRENITFYARCLTKHDSKKTTFKLVICDIKSSSYFHMYDSLQKNIQFFEPSHF